MSQNHNTQKLLQTQNTLLQIIYLMLHHLILTKNTRKSNSTDLLAFQLTTNSITGSITLSRMESREFTITYLVLQFPVDSEEDFKVKHNQQRQQLKILRARAPMQKELKELQQNKQVQQKMLFYR